MEKVKIIADATCSLTKKECEEMGIDCLELSFILDSVEYTSFQEDDISILEHYERLDKVKQVSTSCVNVDTFEAKFREYVSQGYKVIYTGLSGGLSATYANAQTAQKNINEEYGQKMVYTVDSKNGSYGELLVIERIKELLDEGKTLDEVEEIAQKEADNASVVFIAPDLNFIFKIGRLSALSFGIGKLLRIVPIIGTDEAGHLKVKEKCIGLKLAYKKAKNQFVDLINKNKYKKCYFASCNMPEAIDELKKHISENTEIKIEDMKTGLIDKVMSCCCGPRTIAIFCM